MAVILGLGALAPSTFAGSYVVSSCSPLSSPGPWVQTNTAGAGLTAGNLCGGAPVGPAAGGDQGGLYAEDTLGSLAAIPNGSRAGWTFTAPPAATITAISYYRALSADKEPSLVPGLFAGTGAPLEQCMVSDTLGTTSVCSMPNTQTPVTFSGLSTSSLFFGVACRFAIVPTGTAGCGADLTIHAAQADLYSARVTLTQTALPTLGPPSGGLFAAGLVSGVVPVAFAASDPSGIAQELVRGESGQTLVLASQACDFTTVQPCPQLPAGSLNVDTSKVTDGPHIFTLVVTDAAGNSQTASSPSVTVDNNGPPPPARFTATGTAGSNTVNLSWASPTGAPAPVTGAMVQLCQASCPAPVSVSPSGAAQLTAPGPGTYSLRLWLTDAQGRGGPHNAALANVTVPPPGDQTRMPGGSPSPPGTSGGSASSVHTRIAARIKGRQLHVTGTIATNPGTTLKVSWRSRSFGRTLGAGSRTITLTSHRIAVTFSLSHTARTGAIHVAVRSGSRLLASTLARPS